MVISITNDVAMNGSRQAHPLPKHAIFPDRQTW